MRDAQGATGTATVQVTVGPAVQGGVRGAQAELVVPSSVRAFRARGLKVTLSCESTGSGRATLKVTSQGGQAAEARDPHGGGPAPELHDRQGALAAAEAVPGDGAAAGEGEREDAADDAQRVREGAGDARAQGDDPIGAILAIERAGETGLERFRLAHRALPGLDLSEVSLRTRLLGAELAAPVVLVGDCARTATEHGLGLIANELAPDRPPLWLAACDVTDLRRRRSGRARWSPRSRRTGSCCT